MSELKPRISTGKRFNPIWVIPFVALAVGIYMVVQTKLSEGPEITVTFNSAEGLEAGKTRLRFRSVDIGLVKSVALSESMSTVVVTIKLNREATPLLRKDTRFWIVRARVGAGSISGINTILSGAYIQLEPGAGQRGARSFTGLEVPPLTAADAPGLRLVLFSESAGSVTAGDVILYNGFKVGRIESVTFDSDKKEMRYDAFIDAPYDKLVSTASRFWNVSGVSVNASAAGIRLSTGSLDTILLGGVAFGDLPGQPPGEPAASGASYRLNASYNDMQADPYQFRHYYVAAFEQSLRGLEPGAPVEYRGIQVGRVERILIKELAAGPMAGKGNSIPVLFYLEPGRLGFGDTQEAVKILQQIISQGVPAGIRASLQTGSLLTGKLYVNLDHYADVKPASIGSFEHYAVIPSIPSGLGRLELQVATLLDKLNGLPIETTVSRANTTLDSIDGSMVSLQETLATMQQLLDQDATRALPAELNTTLAELRKTLTAVSPDSAVGQSLSNSLFELNRTLRNLEHLTGTLRAKPNALVFPGKAAADPIPEAGPR